MIAKRNISPSQTRPSSQVPKKQPSRPFWIKTLAEFSKSELSAQAFCRLKGLSASNFSTWRKRLREEGASVSAEPATFIPLEVTARDSSFSLLKDSTQNQQPTFSSDIVKTEHDSGLSLYLNESHKVRIDKNFHEPTLQRLVKLFISGVPSEC